MAIKRPDIYQHNNVNLAISDTDFHRGGFRSAVATVNDLYALSGKTGFPSAPGQLKEYSTIVYVTGETNYYVLVDIDNVDNASGWEIFQAGSSGLTEAQNIGGGIGIFSGTSGTTALFKSIIGSGDTTVSLSGDTIVVYSNTGSTTLNDGILRFDSGEQTFLPYDSYTSGITFYTGMTCPENLDRLNLNAHLTVTALRLSTGCTALTGVTFQPGDIYWDTFDSTYSLQQTSNVKQQIGQELFIRVKNNTAGSIPNGTVVYINGSDSGRPTILPARASENDADIIPEVVGMTTETIPAGGIGFVTTAGLVRGINTTGFTEGGAVYLSTTAFGEITDVKPTFPDFPVEVGVVTQTGATDGVILVKITDVSTTRSNIRGVEIENGGFTASTRTDVVFAVGAGTYYLPPDPVRGQQITFVDQDGDASSFTITINGNGNPINSISTDPSPNYEAVINTDFGSMTLIYRGGTSPNYGWRVITNTP